MEFSPHEIQRLTAPFDDLSKEIERKLLSVAARIRKLEKHAAGYTEDHLTEQRQKYASSLREIIDIRCRFERHVRNIRAIIGKGQSPFDDLLYQSYLECKFLIDELNMIG